MGCVQGREQAAAVAVAVAAVAITLVGGLLLQIEQRDFEHIPHQLILFLLGVGNWLLEQEFCCSSISD